MLYLIGLGLDGDLTLEGLAAAKRSKLYLELYTSFLTKSVEDLERTVGKEITVLTREDVEETQELLKEAKITDIALLVVGDPLVATTHTELLIEARKNSTRTKVIHNSSVYSAVAETGLQLYKFGKTITIPFPQKGFEPTSFYETLQKNVSIKAHTLVLLDIQEDKKRYMNPKEAMEILYNLGFREELVSISRLGSESQNIVYGKIEELLSLNEDYWGSPPHCLVVPSSLHFKEEEFLNTFRVTP